MPENETVVDDEQKKEGKREEKPVAPYFFQDSFGSGSISLDQNTTAHDEAHDGRESSGSESVPSVFIANIISI